MKEQTWQQWCRAVERDPHTPSRLRKGSLAALTGTDVRALDAFVPTLKLYAYTGSEDLLGAMMLLLKEMQESTRWIARELIPFVMEWSDREKLWPLIVPLPHPSRGDLHLVGYEEEEAAIGLGNPLARSHP